MAIDLDGLEANLPEKHNPKPKIGLEHIGNLMYANDLKLLCMSIGRFLSGYAIDRYVKGKGGYDVFPYKVLEAASMSSVHWATRDLQRNTITALEGKISDGVTGKIDVSQAVGRNQAASIINDFGTFAGSYDIISYGTFDVKKDDKNDVYVEGIIYFTLRDNYNWKAGKNFPIDHDKMLTLKDLGANDFRIRSYYKMTVKGTNGKYEYGDAVDSSPDEYKQQEKARGDLYDLPEGAKEVNNFTKDE